MSKQDNFIREFHSTLGGLSTEEFAVAVMQQSNKDQRLYLLKNASEVQRRGFAAYLTKGIEELQELVDIVESL